MSSYFCLFKEGHLQDDIYTAFQKYVPKYKRLV